ncbi:hypothetical protein [Streptomyces chilikensis]|uniref:Integral membrane protein n=1 Tax=Streptomyces chilikensis TaxID=1194079 RepID=A0ABV3EQA9_9ACTN
MTPTTTPRRRSRSTRAATAYLGVVSVASLAHGLAGAPDGWGPSMTLMTFPGSTVVTVAALCLAGGGPTATDSPDPGFGPLPFLIPYVAGALVNVLLTWGALAFARHFVREARDSRGASGPS